jgi:hypothetical protein
MVQPVAERLPVRHRWHQSAHGAAAGQSRPKLVAWSSYENRIKFVASRCSGGIVNRSCKRPGPGLTKRAEELSREYSWWLAQHPGGQRPRAAQVLAAEC